MVSLGELNSAYAQSADDDDDVVVWMPTDLTPGNGHAATADPRISEFLDDRSGCS
jgi:hypothetical protein